MNRPLLTMLCIVILTLVATACAPAEAAVNPTDSTTVVVPSVEPTVAPTPIPTPIPTPDPTAIPTPVPTPVDTGTPWIVFLDRIIADGEILSADMAGASDAAGRYDPTGMIYHMRNEAKHAGEAGDWLRANPPQACYAPVHASLLVQYDLLELAANMGVAAWTSMDPVAIDEALAKGYEASAAIDATNVILEGTTCP